MDCEKARQELVAYLDGELGAGMTARVKEHLDGCPACMSEADKLLKTAEALDALNEIEPGYDFTARAMERAVKAPSIAFSSRFGRLKRLLPIAAAAILLIVLSLMLVSTDQEDSQQLTPEVKEIVSNIELLENLELLENMDLISEMELLLEFEEEDFESS